MRCPLVLAALALAGCAGPRSAPPPERTLRLALRVDDVFMHDTAVQPQELDSFLAVAERHGARVELAVIPARLLAPRNADGRMAAFLRAAVARGHTVSQHGWTHRHAPTGHTGGEFMDAATGAWRPADTIRTHLGRGKALLERTVGRPVTKYVGVGTDRQLDPPSTAALRALGFTTITHPTLPAPTRTDSFRYVPDLTDYTWGLTEATFDSTLAAALADVRRAGAAGGPGYVGVGFHDHFTRYAWHGGLVARWLDALLTAAAREPGVRLVFVTADDLF